MCIFLVICTWVSLNACLNSLVLLYIFPQWLDYVGALKYVSLPSEVRMLSANWRRREKLIDLQPKDFLKHFNIFTNIF